MPVVLTALLTSTPLLSYANNGNHSDKWYEVQLVIFLNKNLPTQEHWPENQAAATIPANAITLETPSDITESNTVYSGPIHPDPINNLMVWLPPSSSFAGIISRLKKNGHYPVLYTARWRMPLQAYKTPVTIAIQTAPDTSGMNTLTGSITLDQKRFFYVQPDLTYARPATSGQKNNKTFNDGSASSNVLPMQYFPMQQHQKINLNKLTYIDNPVIGVLIQVTPYTLPEAAQQAASIQTPVESP